MILERHPERVEARDAIAALEERSSLLSALSALLENRQYASVAEQGEALAERFADSVVLHNLLGVAYASLERPEAAIPHFSKVLSIRPDMAQVHVNLGKALSSTGEKVRAIASFREALKLKPDYADAYFSLGTVFSGLARYEQAADNFQRALRLQPDSTDTEINLGSALRDLGRTDEAIACFLRVLKRNPNNDDAHAHLAVIYNRQKRYPEAVAALDAALKIAPERADARAHRLFLASVICDWDLLEREADAIPGLGIAGKAVQPFMLLALDDDPARNRLRAEKLAQARYDLPELAPIARPPASGRD